MKRKKEFFEKFIFACYRFTVKRSFFNDIEASYHARVSWENVSCCKKMLREKDGKEMEKCWFGNSMLDI